MANEIIAPPKREIIAVQNPIPLFDTAVFEHMVRIAMRMARASILPDHLTVDTNGEFDLEATIANCLAVVNQARNWMMDPYAVAQCMSLVHGKPCYEGKLIAAVIETKLGITLEYEWTGTPGEDGYGIRIWDPDAPKHLVTGTVGEWKTKDRQGHVLPQWATPNAQYKQLKYRGDREWCRMWAPALMLGVYSDEEMEDLREDVRARRARSVGGNSSGTPFNPLLDRDGNKADLDESTESGRDKPAEKQAAATTEAATPAETGKPAEPAKPPVEPSDTTQANQPKPASDSTSTKADVRSQAPAEGGEAASSAASEGAKGEATTAVEASPALLLEFSKVLWRAMTVKTLEKCRLDFWKDKPGNFNESSAANISAILEAHRNRCENKVEDAATENEIKRIIGK